MSRTVLSLRHLCIGSIGGVAFALASVACVGGGGELPGGGTSAAGTSGGEEGNPNPAWLVGVYSFDGHIENNVQFTSENRAIEFLDSGSYRFKSGKDWMKVSSGAIDETGKWSVKGGTLVLDSGYWKGETFELSTAMSGNCRTLKLGELPLLSREAAVTGCPFTNTPLTEEEQALVGAYSKGSTSGSGSSTLSESVSIVLEGDRFYRRMQSRTSTVSYGNSSKSLTNSPAAQVGTWTLVDGTVVDGDTVIAAVSELESYDFTAGEPTSTDDESGE